MTKKSEIKNYVFKQIANISRYLSTSNVKKKIAWYIKHLGFEQLNF